MCDVQVPHQQHAAVLGRQLNAISMHGFSGTYINIKVKWE